MTRLVISLAISSGISPDVWWAQDYRTIVTAAELLRSDKHADPEGRQMSG
ncbi:MAG: hypothetical protein ACRDS0_35005 [Pseudonocardiaceae bacterium]